MDRSLVARFSAAVPRYTSYPTAPHFHAGVDAETYENWLSECPADASVSLYLHIPFCDRLCWFCACHTKQVLRYDPVAAYLEALSAEIATVSGLLGWRSISAIHLGGGSPTMLSPSDVAGLGTTLRSAFSLEAGCEISVEVDPNDLDEARLDAWQGFGVTRASFGVQDFDATVQQTINRLQSFEDTSKAVGGFRERGVASVNLDVLYGLPHQTLDTLASTLEQVISLMPDRVALFGYAHVPWMKKHQRLIDDKVLPDALQRFTQARLGASMLAEAGYVRVGLDHFALPTDKMAKAQAEGSLRRNFQGYTTDNAEMLIGLGASAIGRLPQGYVQNIPATGEYSRAVLAGKLPVTRGYALSDADRATAWVIERIMCESGFCLADLRSLYPGEADRLAAEATASAERDTDRLVNWDGAVFRVTERGRPFIRTIAAGFDTFLRQDEKRHSIAV
ncbi:MAG: oxygen-independent coproporphyrinogen III oxidase [Rhizobiaceae bacterium]|nr:oxygen-independent coproporphyrinogen III oxidase [Rhizobiaceae bacterium]